MVVGMGYRGADSVTNSVASDKLASLCADRPGDCLLRTVWSLQEETGAHVHNSAQRLDEAQPPLGPFYPARFFLREET